MSSDELPDGDPASIVRRAPFSVNPQVGARGQRAQQRILEAALHVFGEVGYHQTGIARITDAAGCTRASFYQYFSSKEDVFRHLAGQVARQLIASAEALETFATAETGAKVIRAWVDRHDDIYARFEPVFEAFPVAEENDDAVASGSARVGRRHVATVRARLTRTAVPPRQLDAVIELLVSCMSRTRHMSRVLRHEVDDDWLEGDRVNAALTDVIHRTLSDIDEVDGPQRAGHVEGGPRGVELIRGLHADATPTDLTPAGTRTREALVAAAHDVLVARGYHRTRVDDITAAAGLSHGAFYRYFENKQQVVRLLASRALRHVSASFAAMPDVAGSPGPASSAALRRWLRRYAGAYGSEAAILRVWVDATSGDDELRPESAAALDWGRARLVRFLAPRGFGDIELEALIMVALLDSVSARRNRPEAIEAAATIIERGLFGLVSP